MWENLDQGASGAHAPSSVCRLRQRWFVFTNQQSGVGIVQPPPPRATKNAIPWSVLRSDRVADPHTYLGFDYCRFVSLQSLQFRHATLQYLQLLACASSLEDILLALPCKTFDRLILEIIDDLRGQKVWKLLYEALLNGEDADIINDLLQSNLWTVSWMTSLIKIRKDS